MLRELCQAHSVAAMQKQSVEQDFGRRVNELRTQLGLSQKDLAGKLTDAGMPVDTSAVSRIEKGARALRLAEAITLARVLGVKLDRMVGADEGESLVLETSGILTRFQRSKKLVLDHTRELALLTAVAGRAKESIDDAFSENLFPDERKSMMKHMTTVMKDISEFDVNKFVSEVLDAWKEVGPESLQSDDTEPADFHMRMSNTGEILSVEDLRSSKRRREDAK